MAPTSTWRAANRHSSFSLGRVVAPRVRLIVVVAPTPLRGPIVLLRGAIPFVDFASVSRRLRNADNEGSSDEGGKAKNGKKK